MGPVGGGWEDGGRGKRNARIRWGEAAVGACVGRSHSQRIVLDGVRVRKIWIFSWSYCERERRWRDRAFPIEGWGTLLAVGSFREALWEGILD